MNTANAADHKNLDSLKAQVISGDIIFRNGTDEVSQAARKFNRKDTSFSHCGIIEIENGIPVVYHAIGGSYNPSQHLKRELLDSFATPGAFDKAAVYRYPLSGAEQQRLTNVIHRHYEEQLPFDLFFNFDTDDKMYCSEFVFKSLNESMHGALDTLVTRQAKPVYISIDDLFLNENARLIKRIAY